MVPERQGSATTNCQIIESPPYNKTLFINTIWIIAFKFYQKRSTRVLWFNKFAFWGHFYKTCSHKREAETTFLKLNRVPISFCWIRFALKLHYTIELVLSLVKFQVCPFKFLIKISDQSSKSIHRATSSLAYLGHESNIDKSLWFITYES